MPANKKIGYNYDALDRLSATTFGDGGPGIFRSYTPDGLLQNINTGSSNLTYQYDARRNLVNERDNMWGWNHQWVRNAYGQVAALIDPWGESIDHAPNALGESTKMGRYASNVSYHPNGAVAGFTRGNGSIRSIQQNVRGLPELIDDTGVLRQRYRYDRNGNVIDIVDERDGSTTRNMPLYDGLDRLRQANGPWGVASYDYDALDNLVSSTVGGRSLQHGVDSATNRLTSISGSQSLIFGYDSNGNVVQRGAQGFAYDIGNRMRSAVGNVYDYDGHGRRHIVWPATGGIERPLYTLDGLHRFGYKTTEGHRRYVYLGTQLIAEVGEGNSVSYQHADALGSPVARTDASGNVISRTLYEPYGATAAGTNPTGIGFTGHANDVATGLVYMQQRYYDPIAGRFLSVDPVTTDAKTGDHFNRYVYAENNPYKFKDPDGRAPQLIEESKYAGRPMVGMGQTNADGGPVRLGTRAERIEALQASREARGLQGPPGPAVDKATGQTVGRVVVDSKGNAMIEPAGGKTVPAGKGGVDTHTLNPNGSNYQRLNPQGHGNNPTPHGHGHLPGSGPGKAGQGPSIDPKGNVVPANSPAAHWPIKEK